MDNCCVSLLFDGNRAHRRYCFQRGWAPLQPERIENGDQILKGPKGAFNSIVGFKF